MEDVPGLWAQKEEDMLDSLFHVSFTGRNGLEGHVVVDSLVNATSSGGVRIVPDLALDEVRMLAREMTFKYAFCGLLRGGAKCGVCLPDGLSRQERLAALEDVGRRLAPLIRAGIYYPGMDMNCGPEELGAIYQGAGFALGQMTDTSLFTAIFVAEAVRACADILCGGRTSAVTIAVEGFGKVAGHLAGMLDPGHFRIIALSTITGGIIDSEGFDPAVLVTLRGLHGNDVINHISGEKLLSREDLLSVPADILIPAARVGSIHHGNAGKIVASCVVPAANAPCTSDALEILQRRGIPVLPGFVCNAGGVLGSSLYDRGVSKSEVCALAMGHYRQTVSSLLMRSLVLGLHPTAVATALARRLICARHDEPVSRSRRLLTNLSRSSSVVKRLVNRHAARDCARHFSSVEELIRRMEVEEFIGAKE